MLDGGATSEQKLCQIQHMVQSDKITFLHWKKKETFLQTIKTKG